MTDNYLIDHHKLAFHPERVAEWKNGAFSWESARKIYPIYMEISPTGACNHRCRFCALDFMEYKPLSLDYEKMAIRIPEMAAAGVKSIMFAGEGEPLLYKRITELADLTRKSGIDIAFTTNGIPLDGKKAINLLPITSWIKVSIDAGSKETYAHLHGTSEKDFQTLTQNLSFAVKYRNEKKLSCTIGGQMLLLPENSHEIETLIRIARDEIGLDYLVIKPHSQHKMTNRRDYEGVDYSDLRKISGKLASFNTDKFKVHFRVRTMEKHELPEKRYSICRATPFFWAYLTAGADLYSCSAFLGDARFSLGNLNNQSFQEVWEGPVRKKNRELLANRLDISQCRVNCRMDEINIYLSQLMNPGPHVNFI